MSKVKIAGHASGSGTLTIQAPDTSSSRTITLPDSTDTLIGAATTDALTTRINATGGRKNMIINGAMKVSQRGTSFAAANAVYTVDRFKFWANHGVFTLTQDSDAPAGFGSSLKIDCTTADDSIAAGSYVEFAQYLEGQDLQNLKKGTSDALPVTLSFWVKTNKTGTYQVNILDLDNSSRFISKSYSVSTADTWEKIELTCAGDTTGVLNNDNASSFMIDWWLTSGSTYSNGTFHTSWTANNAADRATSLNVNLADSTSNYFQITGVQLELGSVATDFEYRSYGEELALCQRYFYKTSAVANMPFANGVCNGTTNARALLTYPQIMRANPSMAKSDNTHFKVYCGGTSVDTTSVGFYYGNTQQVLLYVDVSSGLTDAESCLIIDDSGANAYITGDAEL